MPDWSTPHQVHSAGEVPARVAIVSTQNEFGIVEYPDDGEQDVRGAGMWSRPNDRDGAAENRLRRPAPALLFRWPYV
jgi:hypothetical protein